MDMSKGHDLWTVIDGEGTRVWCGDVQAMLSQKLAKLLSNRCRRQPKQEENTAHQAIHRIATLEEGYGPTKQSEERRLKRQQDSSLQRE